MFVKGFDNYVCDGDKITCEVDGFTITARIVNDDDGSPLNDDGHGPVSEWTSRAKAPGERVLCSDRRSHRYYDFAEAVRIARRDGWGSSGDEGLSRGAKAAKAAEHDFEVMCAWFASEWCYCGVVLSISRDDVELDDTAASLWGIEKNYPGSDNAYLLEVANELLGEALEVGRAAMESLVATWQVVDA